MHVSQVTTMRQQQRRRRACTGQRCSHGAQVVLSYPFNLCIAMPIPTSTQYMHRPTILPTAPGSSAVVSFKPLFLCVHVQVNDIAHCPNVDMLASASSDGTVKLWSCTTNQCVSTMREVCGCYACQCVSTMRVDNARGVWLLCMTMRVDNARVVSPLACIATTNV